VTITANFAIAMSGGGRETRLQLIRHLDQHLNVPWKPFASLPTIDERLTSLSLHARNCLLAQGFELSGASIFSIGHLSAYLTDTCPPLKEAGLRIAVETYITQLITQIYTKIPEFACAIFLYFRTDQTHAKLFGTVMYPSLFGYFTIRELIEPSFLLLKGVISSSNLNEYGDSVTSYMFVSFFRGFPLFMNAFFASFFSQLARLRTSYHCGALLDTIRVSLERASRYLTDYHRKIIATVARFPAFFTRHFTHGVLEVEFTERLDSDFNVHCPIGRTSLITDFQRFTSGLPAANQDKIASVLAQSILNCNLSDGNIPEVSSQFGRGSFPYLTSGMEQNLIVKIFDSSPDIEVHRQYTTEIPLRDLRPYRIDVFLPTILNRPHQKFVGFIKAIVPSAIPDPPRDQSLLRLYNSIPAQSRVSFLEKTDSAELFDFFELSLVRDYRAKTAMLEALISERFYECQLDGLTATLEQRKRIILRRIGMVITDNVSFSVHSFSKKAQCYFTTYPSDLLRPFFIFSLSKDILRMKDFRPSLSERRLISRFSSIYRSERKDKKRVLPFRLNASRAKKVDAIATFLKTCDAAPLDRAFFIIQNTVRSCRQVVGSIPARDCSDTFSHCVSALFLKVCLKSDTLSVFHTFTAFQYLKNRVRAFRKTISAFEPEMIADFHVVMKAIASLLHSHKDISREMSAFVHRSDTSDSLTS
jgi:hypothetical protein